MLDSARLASSRTCARRMSLACVVDPARITAMPSAMQRRPIVSASDGISENDVEAMKSMTASVARVGWVISEQSSHKLRYIRVTRHTDDDEPQRRRDAEKSSLMLPLEGITVVAVEQAVAAPFATRQLADLGARIIKIERPVVGDFARGYDATVDGMSSHFVWLNRSKESLTLDLKRTEAVDILRRLLARADVFIHNLAPGAMARLGFASADVRRDYPRLIACEVSGYGSSGPYRAKKAYDLLVQSEAGVLSITGSEEEPAKVGISIADISAGMYAFSG